jgi:hypothetical protein
MLRSGQGVLPMNAVYAAYVVLLLLAFIALLPETDGFSDEDCVD